MKQSIIEYGNAVGIFASTVGGDHPDTIQALENIQKVRTGRLTTFTKVIGAFQSNLDN
jgi:hypothetical protein